MMAEQAALTCPFCAVAQKNEYQLMYHVEIHHSESDEISPFAILDAPAELSSQHSPSASASRHDQDQFTPSGPHSEYAECPYKCGEWLSIEELESHTDLHLAEGMAPEDVNVTSSRDISDGSGNDTTALKTISNTFSTNIAAPLRNYGSLSLNPSTNSTKHRRTPSLKDLFFGSPAKHRKQPKASSVQTGTIQRLGKAELGPYAHEKRMPNWLYEMLEEGAKVTISNTIGPNGTIVRVQTIANETSDMIHVLARLSAMDRNIARAFYCSTNVRHIAKMKHEGGFCGYRNIQMLISYIREGRAPGAEYFAKKIPSIIKLQEMIETAWDMGYNANARIETGGIKNTRKYIGTPEAQALFQSLGIPCEPITFSSKGQSEGYVSLLKYVFEYFDNNGDESHQVYVTEKPPIYFQHKGHSMTIVGVEVQQNGLANLVVFDPMFNPSPSIKKLIGVENLRASDPAKLLKAHRRGESHLAKYKDFELLMIARRPEVQKHITSYDAVRIESDSNVSRS